MEGACGNIRKHISKQDINQSLSFHVETVVLLSKETCRRPDTYVKIGVDVEEYINIKNNGKM